MRANGQFADNLFYDYGIKVNEFLKLNEWQHVVFKIKNGVVSLYLNGNVLGSKDCKNIPDLLTIIAPVEIGRTQ